MSTYHHLYNTAAWRKARAAQLRAEPLCRMHMQLAQVVEARVVDHVRAHRGDMGLFLDASNLQSLCKPCHDAHKQAQEHNADGVLRGAGHDGRPLDLAHPWHRPIPTVEGRGGEKSDVDARKTGLSPSFANCQNSEGGA